VFRIRSRADGSLSDRCHPSRSTAPFRSASSRAFVIGIIIGESPQCIVGASVRVLDGQRAGESITQETPCDVWGYYGGFEFDSLSAGVPMKLRASAHGYADYDTTVYPTAAPQPYTVLKLSRAAEK